jgi:hypothetical protein
MFRRITPRESQHRKSSSLYPQDQYPNILNPGFWISYPPIQQWICGYSSRDSFFPRASPKVPKYLCPCLRPSSRNSFPLKGLFLQQKIYNIHGATTPCHFSKSCFSQYRTPIREPTRQRGSNEIESITLMPRHSGISEDLCWLYTLITKYRS